MTIRNNLLILFSFFLYSSLIFGFVYGEDFNGGAKDDFFTIITNAKLFILDYKYYILNYDELLDRNSPIITIIIAKLIEIGLEIPTIQLIFLHISLFLCFYFYKCLKVIFYDADRLGLKYLSLIVFLSPTFRAISIWPHSRIIGLLFFTISLYYFLKFRFKKKKFSYILVNNFFLAISSYFSPNFSIFALYFFIEYLNYYKLKIEIFYYIIFSIFLAFPAFYYLFILDVFFIFAGGTPGSEEYLKNYLVISYLSNKILIISSIIFFYLIPIIIIKKEIWTKIKFDKFLLIIFLFFIINIAFFDYKIEFTGGGIFFKFSNIFFSNNIFFYVIAFISFYFIYLKYINFNNLLIIFILLISNPQLSIYHKYYDPLLLILFFSIFKINLSKSYFNFTNLSIVYLFYFTLIIVSFYKVNFIN